MIDEKQSFRECVPKETFGTSKAVYYPEALKTMEIPSYVPKQSFGTSKVK